MAKRTRSEEVRYGYVVPEVDRGLETGTAPQYNASGDQSCAGIFRICLGMLVHVCDKNAKNLGLESVNPASKTLMQTSRFTLPFGGRSPNSMPWRQPEALTVLLINPVR